MPYLPKECARTPLAPSHPRTTSTARRRVVLSRSQPSPMERPWSHSLPLLLVPPRPLSPLSPGGAVRVQRDVGCSCLSRVARMACLFYHSSALGCDVESSLHSAAIAHTRERWPVVAQPYASVDLTNKVAIHLFKRHGFEMFGRDLHALQEDGTHIDELHMRLSLTDSHPGPKGDIVTLDASGQRHSIPRQWCRHAAELGAVFNNSAIATAVVAIPQVDPLSMQLACLQLEICEIDQCAASLTDARLRFQHLLSSLEYADVVKLVVPHTL